MSTSLVAYLRHEVLNEHAERMLLLVETALGKAKWNKLDIDRIAVGVGPGSFTGVRVALAIAQGLMLGLGVPGIGVGSLQAIACGLKGESRVRVVVRDARREEFFFAAYDQHGRELVTPHAIPQENAVRTIRERLAALSIAEQDCVVLGTRLEGLSYIETDETVEPDARAVGRLSFGLSPEKFPVVPKYVRGPNVVKPELRPSPLDMPRME